MGKCIIVESIPASFLIKNQFQTDQPERDIFVSQFNPAESPELATLRYSTYIGGSHLEDASEGILSATAAGVSSSRVRQIVPISR